MGVTPPLWRYGPCGGARPGVNRDGESNGGVVTEQYDQGGRANDNDAGRARSSARGPRYSYRQPEEGRGSSGPPSGQFEAWSPVLTASEVLSKRWKAVIMWLLGRQSRRFNELQSHMPGVTPKVLTEQLRELERDGLVERSVIRGGAKHVEYALTGVGERLRPILELLQEWGRSYIATRDEDRQDGRSITRSPAGQGRAVSADLRPAIVDEERRMGAIRYADGRRLLPPDAMGGPRNEGGFPDVGGAPR